MTRTHSDPASGLRRRARLGIGAAGLLAGLIAFGLGEWGHDYFSAEGVPQALSGNTVIRPTLQTIAVADSRNSALTFGVMGGVLGLVLGLAGGLARCSIPGAARGAGIGLFLGTVVGAVLPLVLVIPFHHFQNARNSDDLLAPIGLHAALWGPLGAAAGLAAAVGLGRPRLAFPCLLGGLLGAILGVIAYDIIGASVAPLAGTSEPISITWPTRLLARLLIPVGAALGIASAVRDPGTLAPEPAPAASNPGLAGDA